MNIPEQQKDSTLQDMATNINQLDHLYQEGQQLPPPPDRASKDRNLPLQKHVHHIRQVSKATPSPPHPAL